MQLTPAFSFTVNLLYKMLRLFTELIFKITYYPTTLIKLTAFIIQLQF